MSNKKTICCSLCGRAEHDPAIDYLIAGETLPVPGAYITRTSKKAKVTSQAYFIPFICDLCVSACSITIQECNNHLKTTEEGANHAK